MSVSQGMSLSDNPDYDDVPASDSDADADAGLGSDSSESSDTRELNQSTLGDWSDEERTFYQLLDETYGPAGGSVPRKRAPKKKRDRVGAHERLVNDYFCDNPVYDDTDFQRRFRMSRSLFVRIANILAENFVFFRQRPDAVGEMGFSTLQKCTAAVRLLAYGTASDSMDDYLKMSARTARECMYKYCRKVYKLFRARYLRKPNSHDIQQLYAFHETQHGFRGMLGSLDCTHWEWQNCPNAWRGAYTRGDHGVPTVMLEAVASQDMWIWHAFFGPPGSNNDITVIRQSDIFSDIFTGRAPDTSFEVNGTHYKYGYYLTDGIYPEWATIVKSYSNPQDPKRVLFKTKHEAARKDIERAFGMLKQKWHIMKRPSRAWYTENLHKIMYAILILNNMIIEDNGDAICTFVEEPAPAIDLAQRGQDAYISRVIEVQSHQTHHNLRHDLTEFVWENRDVNNN